MTGPTVPAIATVIPTHDRPEMLRRAIAAVLAQEYDGRIDVVVVFDQAEPDFSLVASSHERSVRVVANTRSAGLPGARNSGIAECAHADYIAFCDDDDVWAPNKLARQVEALERRRDAALCTTGIVIDFDGEMTERPSPKSELSVADLVRDRTTEAHPSTFLFRRSVLEAVGPVDEQIPGGYSEDYDLLLRVAAHGTVVCVHEPLVTVRWGRTSYFTRRWQTIVDAQRYLLAKHPAFHDDRRAEARIRGQIAFALAALGDRRGAWREIGRVVVGWPFEKRWLVAAAVSVRLVQPERVLSMAHSVGRGI